MRARRTAWIGRAIVLVGLLAGGSTGSFAQTPATEPASGSPTTQTGGPQTTQPPSPPPKDPEHIFVVVPSYNVTNESNVPPLTTGEKLREFLEGTYDPTGLAFAGVETILLEHSRADGFCGYGPGAGGFAKCWGSARLDATVGGFFGDVLFPAWMHQDPRYFRLGPDASVGRRVGHALSGVFVRRSETTGKPVFNLSDLAGIIIEGALSNLYYPRPDRGLGLTMGRIGIDMLGTVSFNTAAEFWQDIDAGLSGDGRPPDAGTPQPHRSWLRRNWKWFVPVIGAGAGAATLVDPAGDGVNDHPGR